MTKGTGPNTNGRKGKRVAGTNGQRDDRYTRGDFDRDLKKVTQPIDKRDQEGS